jgi:hypothetical protein
MNRKISRPPKKKRKISTKISKDLIKRIRYYVRTEDQNRRWKGENIINNLISSIIVSRLNSIGSNRSDILSKQRKASQSIQQLNAEYNSLAREYDKRDKLMKDNLKIKGKLESLKQQRVEQEKKLAGYKKQKKN